MGLNHVCTVLKAKSFLLGKTFGPWLDKALTFEIHCHGCSVHIYEKIRSAIKGETGIEGESRMTRSPLYFHASGLRGKIIEGESEWESFGIICFEWNPILECHQSSTQES